MRALCCLVILTLSSASLLWAQTSAEYQIQEIKNTPGTLWVEETASSEEEAVEAAKSSLQSMVHDRYQGALQALTTSSDPEVNAQRAQVSMNYQTISSESRRRTTVLAYISEIEAVQYVQRYITSPYRTDRYIFGEGSGATRDEAIAQAQQDLITQMIVQVFSEQETTIQEVDMEFSEEFRSQARAVSQMQLINARREAFPIGDQFYAMVYMTEEDKDESFDMVKNQATSFVDEGERFRGLGFYTRAIENYYRAYLLSMNYNRSIEYSLGGQEVSNLRDALRLEIENYLYMMSLNVSPAYEHSRRTIEIPFEVTYNEERVDGVFFGYNIGGSNSVDQVRHGQAKIQTINYFPERRIEVVPVNLWLNISNITERDPMLASLEEVHKIEVTRNVEVDYSNVLRPSIQAHIEGATVYFSIHSPFLTATHARWDFGDGETATGLSAEHSYMEQDEYKVSVVLNNDQELSDIKYVNLFRGIAHNRPSMMEQSPELRTMSENLMASNDPEEELEQSSGPRQEVEVQETAMEPDEEEDIPEVNNEEVERKEEVFAELTGFQTFRSLTQKMAHMKNQGLIEFGNRDDFHNLEGALVIVSDPQTVHDYLFFRNNRYLKVDTGEEVVDLGEKYEGMYQIWIQIN